MNDVEADQVTFLIILRVQHTTDNLHNVTYVINVNYLPT